MEKIFTGVRIKEDNHKADCTTGIMGCYIHIGLENGHEKGDCGQCFDHGGILLCQQMAFCCKQVQVETEKAKNRAACPQMGIRQWLNEIGYRVSAHTGNEIQKQEP